MDNDGMLRVSFKKQLGGNLAGNDRRTFDLDVDFTVPGGITILFGPSGSGKTTCLRAEAEIVTKTSPAKILGGNR